MVETSHFRVGGLGVAVGVIAGFVANGMIMAVVRIAHVWYERPVDWSHVPRAMWETAIALLLMSSAVARVKTHYALEAPYDGTYWLLDTLLVVAASAVLGLSEATRFPGRWFWGAVCTVCILLWLRNARLKKHKHSVPRAQRWIAAGGFLTLGALLATPFAGPPYDMWIAVVLAVFAIVGTEEQFRRETMDLPFREALAAEAQPVTRPKDHIGGIDGRSS